jgi:heme exporter protein CcmD
MSGFAGEYGAFVWPAYALTVLVMAGLLWASLGRLRRVKRELAQLERTQGGRRRRRDGAD